MNRLKGHQRAFLAITLRDIGVDSATIEQVTARIQPYKADIVQGESVQ